MFPPIQTLVNEYQDLHTFLSAQSEISHASAVDNHFRKVYLMSCASYYEKEISEVIEKFVLPTDPRIANFVRHYALKDKFFVHFNLRSSSANIKDFLSLFGPDFKSEINNQIKQNNTLEQQVFAFYEIMRLRNNMVHDNFLTYNLEKTFNEIHELNLKAIEFIAFLKNILK